MSLMDSITSHINTASLIHSDFLRVCKNSNNVSFDVMLIIFNAVPLVYEILHNLYIYYCLSLNVHTIFTSVVRVYHKYVVHYKYVVHNKYVVHYN